MPNARYLNLISFPAPLEFKNSALGLRRGIRLGNLSGMIHLPRPNNPAIGKPFESLLAPRLKDVDFVVRVHLHMAASEEPHMYWGKYFSWTQKDPEGTAIASVNHALVSFAARQGNATLSPESVAEKCLQEIPAWSARLADWIEVLTRDDLNTSHPLHAAIVQPHWISTAWIYSDGRRPDYMFVNPPLTSIGSRGENALDAVLWTRAIRAANNRRDIPETWALIRDARAAQRRGLGRRAVLDAATAAELIIEKQLRAHLSRSNPPTFVDKLMKSTWQVSRRIELMRSLGLWLPANLDADLTSLRNGVVHNNSDVNKPAAKAAVDAVEELARRYELTLLK
jgi:hypothetical protein